MMSGVRRRPSQRNHQEGAALVEFALVLPLLLVLVMGIIDFGLYFYNDLLLTQAARDAVRYASVGDSGRAGTTIANVSGMLVSTAAPIATINIGTSGGEASVTLRTSYRTLTPLPGLVPGIGSTIGIDATARMRRE